MEPIHELSAIAPLSEYDLWGVPPTQLTVEKDFEVEYRPISTVDNQSPITFLFSSNTDEYIKLDNLYLYYKFQVNIEKDDSDASLTNEDWTKVGICNYSMHAMIKQIDFEINGKNISSLPQNYAYRAYIETLLGYAETTKKSHLQSAMWIEDDEERNKFIKPISQSDLSKGRKIDVYGKLHTDLCYQSRALIGGCQVKLMITLNDPSFYLKLNSNYSAEVKFTDFTLLVHKTKVSSMIVDAHRKALTFASAKYPITRIEVRQFPIPKDLMDIWIDNVTFGQLPRRMFLCIVENKAFNGSYEKDPFEFKHFNVNYLCCYLDGNQYPSIAYTPDFGSKLYMREYNGLFQALNQNGTDNFYSYKREDFINKPIFGFNFAPDMSNGCGAAGHVNAIKRGSMRLQLKFKNALTEPINVICYCEFDNIIEIQSDGNVLNSANGQQTN
ncbi:MAG: hypothetical protein QM535_22425 [Limnohabitans sp.]|nr:hypothetical protein [Limnohabitans sp.]